MAAERYLSRRIPDLRVGNNIDEIDKKLIPASIHPCSCGIYTVEVLKFLTLVSAKKAYTNRAGPDQTASEEAV